MHRPPLSYLMIWLCLLAGLHRCTGQVTRFVDGKKLELSSRAEFLRVDELLRDGNWQEAVNQLVSISEERGSRLLLLEPAGKKKCRVFLTARQMVQRTVAGWGKTAPEALRIYRERMDTEAEALLQAALEGEDVEQLQQVVQNYFCSSIGDDATDRLAHIRFEKGFFSSAETCWNALISAEGFPVESNLRYPDSDLPQLELVCHSLACSVFQRDSVMSERKLEFLRSQFPGKTFLFAGKRGLSWDQLGDAVRSTLQRLKSGNQATGWPVDLQGKSSWKVPLNPQSRKNMPGFGATPPVADYPEFTLATFPEFYQQNVYWRDDHQVYRWSLAQPDREGETDSRPETIWSTPFPEQTSPDTRKRLGRPVFDLTLGEGMLFARMGDPRTSYRNDRITRNRSYLLGLDLQQGERLLPGFPLENEDPRIEFDATPVVKQGRLFVVRRKTFRDNAVGQIRIECLELSQSSRAEQLKVRWRFESVSGESNNRGTWDEVTNTRLLLVEDQVAFVGLGFVVLLDQASGQPRWIADYHRDRFSLAGSDDDPVEAGLPTRFREQAIFVKGKLLVAPSDSRCLFCFDGRTGRCLWKAETEGTSHLLGTTEDAVLVSGHHLHWYSMESGKLVARFPATRPSPRSGFGLSEVRGIGEGMLVEPFFYWPTMNKIFVFETEFNRAGQPVLRQVVDLKMRKVSGGNLRVRGGIMLIAGDQSLVAFEE
ncbi:MAG: hypothetical protein VX768_21360 [Planctomycetota bacterium]|nr:hypothetical protein [Planctomycetota bacterium]